MACIKPHTKPQHIYLDRVLILYDFWGKVSLNIIKTILTLSAKCTNSGTVQRFFPNWEISCLHIGIENIVLFRAPYHRKNDNYTTVRERWQRRAPLDFSTRVYVCNIIKLTEAIISVCCRNEHVKGGASVTMRWKMREEVCLTFCRSDVRFFFLQETQFVRLESWWNFCKRGREVYMMKSLRYYIQNVSGIIKLSNQYIMHIYTCSYKIYRR